MIKYQFTDAAGRRYERVDRRTAKKAYIAGETIYLCASNLRPFTMWHAESSINRAARADYIQDDTGAGNDFENMCNSFSYYNCVNAETGKRISFYMEAR